MLIILVILQGLPCVKFFKPRRLSVLEDNLYTSSFRKNSLCNPCKCYKKKKKRDWFNIKPEIITKQLRVLILLSFYLFILFRQKKLLSFCFTLEGVSSSLSKYGRKQCPFTCINSYIGAKSDNSHHKVRMNLDFLCLHARACVCV